MARHELDDKAMTRESAQGQADATIPFGPIFAELANEAENELMRTTAMAGLEFQPPALASARHYLLTSMAGVAGLALWTELHRHDRGFHMFSDHVRAVGLDAVLAPYPVLSGHLQTVRAQWVTHLAAISASGATDLRVEGEGILEIQGVGLGLSDRHGGGRTVTRVDLSDGRRFAYKPRSLSAELLFDGVLSWVEERCGSPPQVRPLILGGQSHGWMEWIEPADCVDRDDVRSFFRRAGRQLLVLHVLCAVDCHAENVIARGAEPFLVDVETLGHPESETTSHEGVLRTGYLPYWKKLGGSWFGLGGLGSPGSDPLPWDVGSWLNVNRDQMALAYASMPRPKTTNLPTLGGRPLAAYDFANEIIAGFQEAGHILLEGRADLLAADGPLGMLASTRVRFLARSTQLYGELLASAVQPQALRSTEQLHRTLTERLQEAPAPLAIRSENVLRRLIELEVGALLRLDIPRFEFDLGSTTLESTDGKIASFLKRAGAETIRTRIDEFSGGRLEEQCGLIRAALVVDQLADAGAHEHRRTEGADSVVTRERERRYYPFRPPLRG